MSDHKEDLIELITGTNECSLESAKYIAEAVTAQYALIPRPDIPALDERGEASDEWWEETVKTEGADRRRHYAAYSLARAEWLEAREAAEAETKLSERRNKVLAEIRGNIGASSQYPYEDAAPFGKAAVDMIIEAQDGAGK